MLPLYHFLSLLPFLLSSKRTKKFEDTFKEIKEMKIVNTLISNNLHMISQIQAKGRRRSLPVLMPLIIKVSHIGIYERETQES